MTDFEIMLTQIARDSVIDYVEPDYYPERYCLNKGYITVRLEDPCIDIKWIFDPHGKAIDTEVIAR